MIIKENLVIDIISRLSTTLGSSFELLGPDLDTTVIFYLKNDLDMPPFYRIVSGNYDIKKSQWENTKEIISKSDLRRYLLKFDTPVLLDGLIFLPIGFPAVFNPEFIEKIISFIDGIVYFEFCIPKDKCSVTIKKISGKYIEKRFGRRQGINNEKIIPDIKKYFKDCEHADIELEGRFSFGMASLINQETLVNVRIDENSDRRKLFKLYSNKMG